MKQQECNLAEMTFMEPVPGVDFLDDKFLIFFFYLKMKTPCMASMCNVHVSTMQPFVHVSIMQSTILML